MNEIATIIGKNFAIYDLNDFPVTTIYKDGEPLRNRQLVISPYTTGEPIMILKTTKFATEEKKPTPSKEYLQAIGHTHEFAEEIMIFDHDAIACADNIMFDIPKGAAYVAKAGCFHSNSPADSTKVNTILCIFTPSIPMDQDADYPILIEKTKKYIAEAKRV